MMGGSMPLNEMFLKRACTWTKLAMVMCCLTWHLATCYSTQHWTASQRCVPHCLIALTASALVHHLVLLRMTPCEFSKGNWLSGVESDTCVMWCKYTYVSWYLCQCKHMETFSTVIHVGCKEGSRSACVEAVWSLLVVLVPEKGSFQVIQL